MSGPEPDGGTVTETRPGASGGFLSKLRDRDDFVVLSFALGVLLFPLFVVEVLSVLGDVVGVSIGGYVGLPSLVLIFGIVVVGFDLLLGYTGLLSFGHAAFFGTAAYAAAIFSGVFGDPIVMMIVGAVVATLLAWPIGFVSIRRSGVYFAVLTLTFGQMLYFWALGPGSWLTNGDNGFSSVEVAPLLGVFHLDDAIIDLPILEIYTFQYLFVGAIAILAIWVANRILNSPYGLIFEALGENEIRVSFVGLNVFRYKLMAFIISAAFAGVGGALFVIHETYIHPTTGLYWITSGDFVIMAVLGGTGSLIGPVFGAFLFEYVSNVISGVSLPVIGSIGSMWRFVLGGMFVIVVWVFPKGVYGALRDGGRALYNRVANGGGDD